MNDFKWEKLGESLGMYGSIFDCHTPAGGTTGILWVEARDGGKHPTMHVVANVSSAKREKGWCNLSCYVDSLVYKDSPGHVIVTV